MKSTLLIASLTALVLAACTSHSTSRDEDDDDDEGAPTAVAAASASSLAPAPLSGATVLAFDQEPAGALPAGWKAEGTNQKGPVATWKVIADATAPSKPNVLSLTSPNHDSGSTFNVCWTDRARFKEGRIEVSLKPNTGSEDQGGGPIWRVQDKDEYYICRANPLESNFRVYYVQNGSRHQLASADVKIATGKWHTIAIEHHGERIACWLDGEKLLEATDGHLPNAGGVGVWTKSDAASSFDDLKIQP
jgi:hypothetical protein